MALRISVALCTYDGARYLPEQLSSLAAQRRPPDEVVISDDGSNDGTMDLIERFASAVGFPTRVSRTSTNLGSSANFGRAMSLCSGDVIALCDQDDVWAPNKLARLEEVFESRPEVAAVFTDAELIDGSSMPLGQGLWERLGFDRTMQRWFLEGQAIRILGVFGNVATGATMAVRARYRELVVPIPSGWVHDYWIALLVSSVARMLPLDERLINYRLHGGQQIGVPEPPKRLTWRDHAAKRAQLGRRMRKDERAELRRVGAGFAEAARRLDERRSDFTPDEGIVSFLAGKGRHMSARGEMPDRPGRLRAVVRELVSGRYHRYSSGFSSAVKDALLLDRPARELPTDAPSRFGAPDA